LLFSHRTGRRVYSYTNVDCDWISFVLQELRILFFMILLARFWALVSEDKIQKERDAAARYVGLGVDVADAFSHWQRDSLLLVFVFFPWTLYYSYIGRSVSDHRFIVSGVLMHSIWLSSWAVASRHVWRAWHSWIEARRLFLKEYLATNRIDSGSAAPAPGTVLKPEAYGELLKLEHPINLAQLVVTALATSIAWLGSLAPLLTYLTT
jgi:hypothetical protein